MNIQFVTMHIDIIILHQNICCDHHIHKSSVFFEILTIGNQFCRKGMGIKYYVWIQNVWIKIAEFKIAEFKIAELKLLNLKKFSNLF